MAGTISSIGIGTSGLDVSSIISKLVDLEKAPLAGLQTAATTIGTKITAYGQIKSLASTLSDSALSLSLSTTWKAVSTTSSDTSVSVGSSGTSIPAVGEYSVQVQQLAKAQATATDSFGAAESVGTGTLRIQLGSWSADHSTFTAGSSGEVSISIADGENTPAQIAAKINAAGAGVTATVITDTTGQRLLVRSNATGDAAGFRIQADDAVTTNTTSQGLSRLAFDPQTGAFGMASSANSGSTTWSQNAKATLNNIPVTSASNTFADTVPGLTFSVSQETSSAVKLTVANDTTAMAKSVQDFVSAFNALNTFIGENTKYDASASQGGLLQGDSAAVGIQNMLRNVIGSSTSGGAFSRLTDIGVSFQQDGSLSVDSAKLNSAFSDMTSVANLFTSTTGSSDTQGFGVKLKAFMTGILSSTGTITNRTNALTDDKARNADDQTKLNDHVDQVQDRLQKTYTALDTKMASLTALNTYITQQVAQWNKSTG